MENIYLTIVLAPLIGAIIVGLAGHRLGRTLSHSITILGVTVSTVLALYVFNHHVLQGAEVFNENIYTWMQIGGLNMSVGFLVDNLTSVMLLVVSFVSLMVHIYTIGYMQEDEGYTKFFSYISLFTFAMFMLVISNNFMQLFFGWEAVGLVSYLLIGFWHHKESAVEASLKAFLVNRVGDFGFLLGIAVLLMFFGTLDYVETFTLANQVNGQTIFGDISVTKVLDGTEKFKAATAFPDVHLDHFHQHLDWISPFYDFDSESIIISTHSYVVKTPEFTAVVDTCIGNDKNRIGSGPLFKANKGVLSQWNNRNSPYLDNLIQSGVDPKEVDYVMCTHMHADHVGWNTKLQNGHWVPTFPNAQYLFSQTELDGMLEQTGNPFDEYLRLAYEDSVLPIIQSGQSIIIDSDFDLGKGITILPTPGHSPGHYCIELRAHNAHGILTGDVLHNPIQVCYPHWTTMFCEDKEQANKTRMKLVDDLTDSDIIVLAAHFSGTTAGKIVSDSNGTKFNLLD